MDICQPEVPTCVLVGQTFVVQAKHVQNGGVPIVDVHPSIDRLAAEWIGCAVDHATPNPTTRSTKDCRQVSERVVGINFETF